MHKYLFSVTILLVSLTLCSEHLLAQDALGQLEALAGQSASSVDIPDAPTDFVCEWNCSNQSKSSSSSTSSGTSYAISPSAAFATGVASGFLEGFFTSMLSGPSPAEIERQRRIALEAERHRLEEQRRIEERNRAIQAQLISNLAPIGGQLPSMNTSIGANGIGNGETASNKLAGKLVSLDDSTDAYTKGRMFDSGAPFTQDPVDLRLVNINSAVPKIPGVSDPIGPRSRLPDEFLNDPRYVKSHKRIALDEELLAEKRKELSDLDDQMYDGKIEDVEKWRRMRADKLQDIANLENIVARQEDTLQNLAKEYEIDPLLIYEDRAELAYLKSGYPADRTRLAFDVPRTSTTSDFDANLTPEFSHLQSSRRLELLNDAEFEQIQNSVATLNFYQEEINRNYAKMEKGYLDGNLDPAKWQNYLTDYKKAASEVSQSLEVNNKQLDKMYRKYDFSRPTNGELFYEN